MSKASPVLEDAVQPRGGRDVRGPCNGVPVTAICRAGHNNQWTVVLRSTSVDKVQILCVSPEYIQRSGANDALTPLMVCEQVVAVVNEACKDLTGPVKGQAYLDDIRDLTVKSRERILAESTST